MEMIQQVIEKIASEENIVKEWKEVLCPINKKEIKQIVTIKEECNCN